MAAGWGKGTLEASFENVKNPDSHADQTDGNSGVEATNDLGITGTERMRAHLEGVLKQKDQRFAERTRVVDGTDLWTGGYLCNRHLYFLFAVFKTGSPYACTPDRPLTRLTSHLEIHLSVLQECWG